MYRVAGDAGCGCWGQGDRRYKGQSVKHTILLSGIASVPLGYTPSASPSRGGDEKEQMKPGEVVWD